MPIHGTKDALYIVPRTLPAAAGSNQSAALDLKSVDAAFDKIEVEIAVEALPSLADTKNLTITLQDSADGSSFAAIPELATLVIVGAGGVGAAAKTRVVRLPPSCRRYIRLNCAVDAVGGDNTAKTATLSLLF